MGQVKTLEKDDLKIEITEEDDLIKISWLGKCTLKNPAEFLDPILDEQYQLSKKKNKALLFHFNDFKYMNSSAIIPIIKILKYVRDGIGIVHVVYNRNERWQEIMLGELRIFETDDKRVKIRGV